MKDLEEHKEMKIGLSALKSSKPFPLIYDTELSEYWSYLTKFHRSSNTTDGLLSFIRDFYSNVKKNKSKLCKEMVTVTINIRDTLSALSDDLHRLLESYGKHLINIQQILDNLNSAI